MKRPQLIASALAVAAPILAGAAAAQDRPPLFPTRDVSVAYRVTETQARPAGQPALPGMTLSWLAAAQTMRVDLAGMGWMVADHRAQRGFMVMEQMRMVMNIPMDQVAKHTGMSPTARFRRTGSATVAGHGCTVWNFEDGNDRGTACITTDGVMLRAQGSAQGQSGSMEATQVTYGAQDPARFQVPAGYQTMQMPQGMPNIPGLSGAPRR
ncbi:hypothetical protein ACLF3G_11330 [Falsiroseomonas sp. HC035]|uniref:hypothetical protein n=1 Tax=Falsiroseomonas sp. HC035 TaxID=3390999 RepID=UPI003D31677A